MANENLALYPIPTQNGFMEMQNPTSPAAGSDWYFTIPDIQNEWRYRIHSLHFYFLTDATVANRQVGLRLFRHTGAYTVWRYYVLTMAASTGYNIVFDSQVNESATTVNGLNGWYFFRLPHCELTSWFRLGTTIAFMQAGDQISDIEVSYRRWLDQND